MKKLATAVLMFFIGAMLVAPAFAMGIKPTIAKQIEGPIKVGLLHDGYHPNDPKTYLGTMEAPTHWGWLMVPGVYMAIEEITDAGYAVEVYRKNSKDDPADDPEAQCNADPAQCVRELIRDGVVYIAGGQGSPNSVISAPIAVRADVVYSSVSASTDQLSGCPNYGKGAKKPGGGKCYGHEGYFYRTHVLSSDWGVAAAQYLDSGGHGGFYSGVDKVAMTYQAGAFGEDALKGFREKWVSLEHTFLGDGVVHQQGWTWETFKDDVIEQLTANGTPDVIVGAWGPAELGQFVKAWAMLEATVPTFEAMYGNVKFLNVGSVRGNYSSLLDDSPAEVQTEIIEVMSSESRGIQPHYDPDSAGYKAWYTSFEAFDPGRKHWKGTEGASMEIKVMGADNKPLLRHSMASYDAAMLYFLAMAKAIKTTENLKTKLVPGDPRFNKYVVDELWSVANPPGEVIYPGEFSKALGKIESEVEINYEGASGPCDINKQGNVLGLTHLIWSSYSDLSAYDLDGFYTPTP